MAGAKASKLPPPSTGKTLTVLSIDGGGIRGLIPAVALQFLESELKKVDGDGARIADYFDVIGGVSTGGLIAAMLTAPNGNKDNPRPKFTADDVRNFYFDYGPQIFPDIPDPPINKRGPKHDGEKLREGLERELGLTLSLEDTWTNVVIPAFDIKLISPAIFSSYKLNGPYKDQLNATLYDICIATSAAPTYLPAHKFQVGTGEDGTYHTVDGGLAAGNPTLVALSEIGQEKLEHPELYPMMERADDCSNVLLVSLGCGVRSPRLRGGFTADQANNWSLLQWLMYNGRSPLTEFVSDGSMDTMDFYIFSLFKAHNAERNYLRVQTDTLTPEMAIMDNAKPENLNNLENCGKEMLKGDVKRVNPVTFRLEPTGEGTYAEALTRVAEILSKERRIRNGTYIGIPLEN